jgi:hypothetical protein
MGVSTSVGAVDAKNKSGDSAHHEGGEGIYIYITLKLPM